MKEFLKAIGVPVSDSVQVTDISIAFHGLGPTWAIIIGLAVIAATAWVYLTTAKSLSTARKTILIVLRSLLLAMIILMLMRPVLLLTVEGTIRRSLLVLIDASASMQIKDLRQDPADLTRAAIAKGLIDPSGGIKQSAPGDNSSFNQLSRAAILKAMLTNDKLQLLSKLSQTYDVIPYTFGQSLQALSSTDVSAPKTDTGKSYLDTIVFDKPYTAIGDSVHSLLDLKRGQPLAGVFLITDGGNNYGRQPVDAAAMAQQDKVPLYIYGVGITSPHDIIVSQVFAPEVVFAREESPVTVTIKSQAMNGRTAKLVLKLGDTVMDGKDITFGDDGEQTVNMKFTPPKAGNYELEASIEPLADEAIKDNNKASQRVRVIDGKIKVLYIEQKPRWEFRYLQALLVRDRRLDPKFVLIEGDSDLSKEQGSPYLANIPTEKPDIMQYDVIIIGDVDSKLLGAQMQSFNELVSSFGGGIVFLAGRKFMPDSYRRTPLEAMLPVEFEGQSVLANPNAIVSKAINLDLTPAGQESLTMRLVGDADENAAIWKKLPGVYWDARVSRAKPAAEVFLTDPTPEKATRAGAMPVIALQSYGTGQAMFIGTDETWRMRRNVGEKYYTKLWGQIILRLGLPRLMGASRLTQLTTERKNYVSGERVVISGRLYRSGFQPVTDASVQGTLTIKADDGAVATPQDLRKPVSLQASPGRPGYYEGEIVVTTPGIYTFTTDSDANNPNSVLDFRVSQPKFEIGETAMNVALLKKMAETSGGAFYREEDLYKMLLPDSAPHSTGTPDPSVAKIPNGLGGSTEKVPSPQEVELAFSKVYFALMILVATVEWILRKRWRLK